MTTPGPKPPKLMKIRNDDRCADCGLAQPAGSLAWWFPAAKAVRCKPCGDAVNDGDTATSAAVHGDSERSATGQHVVERPAEWTDVAGGSAQREYEKRSARELTRKQQRIDQDAEWRAKLKADHRFIGSVVTALTPKPTIGPETQATTAWKTGAEGERRAAEIVDALHGIEVLHDRKVPGTKANVDHIAITASGVYVVDAKKYAGKIEVRDVGGWFRSDVRLYVGGRDRTKLVDGVEWQIDVVRRALGEQFEHVAVHGVLCFIGAEWELLFPRPKTVRDVVALWPALLGEHVSRAGSHVAEICGVAAHLRAALKPAVR